MSRFDTFEGKKSDLKILILEIITKPPKVIVNKFLCRRNSWLGAPLPTFEGSFLLFSWVFITNVNFRFSLHIVGSTPKS